MRVANRKCIRRLSFAQMKAARTRNIITVLAIALTTVLFTTLFTSAMSIVYGYQQSNFRAAGSYNHGAFKNITRETFDALKDDPLIAEYGERLFLGMPIKAPFYKNQVEISYCDETEAGYMFLKPKKGRLPLEGTNEAATDTTVLSLLGVEPVIGNEFTITFQVDGVETTQTFTLCGYWDYDPAVVANHVLLPRSRVERVLDELDTQGSDRMTGYWTLNVMFRSANRIEENLRTILERHDCQNEDSTKERYVMTGVNWAYVAAQFDDAFDAGTALALAAVLILIGFTGYLIIYNIFHISVAGDVRFYGLLKTIGTTGRQIGHIILRQACTLSVVGISIGLGAGYGLGMAVTHVVVGNLPGVMEVYSLNPLIFLGSAVFSFLTVVLSCRKPCRMAAKVSPMEALRYTEGGGVRKRFKRVKKGASVAGMAWANLGRNKKKTTVTAFSLSLAIVLLEMTYILSTGFSMEMYFRNIKQDFILAAASHFQAASIRWGEDKAVSEEAIAQISAQDGVTGGRTYGQVSVIREFAAEEWIRYVKGKNGWNKEETDAYVKYRENVDGMMLDNARLYGMEDFILDKLVIVEGDITKLKEGSGYIAAVYQTDDYGNVKTDTHWVKPGGKVKFRYVEELEYFNPETGEVYAEGEDLRGKLWADRAKRYRDVEYEVCALVTIPKSLNYRFYGSDEFVMGADAFRQETGTEAVLYYAFDCEDDRLDAMEAYMAQFTTDNEWYDYESRQQRAKDFEGLKRMFLFVGAALSFIVGLIGVLNFLNAVLSSILSRRKEFALLQSVGMTGRQLTIMLITEGVVFACSAVVITLVLSVVMAPLMRDVLEGMFWFFSYHFTVTPIVAVIPVFVLMGTLIPLAVYRHVVKKSVVERLREAE